MKAVSTGNLELHLQAVCDMFYTASGHSFYAKVGMTVPTAHG